MPKFTSNLTHRNFMHNPYIDPVIVPFIDMVNHSNYFTNCDVEQVWKSDGWYWSLFAIKDIKVDQQLFIRLANIAKVHWQFLAHFQKIEEILAHF